MLIGDRYSDKKIYRGIKHYNSYPLTSEDLHEYSDTIFMKNAYIMNNIIGYGILNSPSIGSVSPDVTLSNPAILLIDGDVSLIGGKLVSLSNIASAGYSEGAICIVGWYQHLDETSVLKEYGGVDNVTTPNDIKDKKLDLQVSTRFQFRWSPLLIDASEISSDNISFILRDRDKEGVLLETSSSISTIDKINNVFVAPIPPSMQDYATNDSKLYVVPILKYKYSNSSNSIESIDSYLPITPKGSSGFINSNTEPVGEFLEGTTWYNPDTREFKTYVIGTGFIDNTSSMGFLQYQSSYTIEEDISTNQDIVIPINISELEEGDVLQISYEGLLLSKDEHYNVDYATHTLRLLNFTANRGDRIVITATKIVEASDISNITTTFLEHMRTRGSSTIEAHVRLADVPNANTDSSKGVAATPKAVYEATLVKDSIANRNYRFGVENGLLYIEEVE